MLSATCECDTAFNFIDGNGYLSVSFSKASNNRFLFLTTRRMSRACFEKHIVTLEKWAGESIYSYALSLVEACRTSYEPGLNIVAYLYEIVLDTHTYICMHIFMYVCVAGSIFIGATKFLQWKSFEVQWAFK